MQNLYAITIEATKAKTNEEIVREIAKAYIQDFLKMLRTIKAISYYGKLAYYSKEYPDRACTHIHAVVESELSLDEIKNKLKKRGLKYHIKKVTYLLRVGKLHRPSGKTKS